MKLTFLGTGTSYGVPFLGCDCQVCRSTDTRDKRLRASILVEDEATRLLVDTGPDLRQQALRCGLKSLAAVLWTHLHNDHIIGLDDIRPLTDRQGYIPGYADQPTMERLRQTFHYAFEQGRNHAGFPRMTPHVLEPFQSVTIGAIQVTPLPIMHGPRPIFAYEFASENRRMVYATDCSFIGAESMERMRGCDIFVVDALRHSGHPNHFSVAQALEAVAEVGPGAAYLTHITHELSHADTQAELPTGVFMAWDELTLEV